MGRGGQQRTYFAASSCSSVSSSLSSASSQKRSEVSAAVRLFASFSCSSVISFTCAVLTLSRDSWRRVRVWSCCLNLLGVWRESSVVVVEESWARSSSASACFADSRDWISAFEGVGVGTRAGAGAGEGVEGAGVDGAGVDGAGVGGAGVGGALRGVGDAFLVASCSFSPFTSPSSFMSCSLTASCWS